MTAFADQVAVVTGASSGVGRAIALGLAAEGATVCLVARTAQRLEAVAEAARAGGGEAQCYPADLAQDEHMRELCDCLLRDFGHIDILVHCAGAISLGPIERASAEEFDRQYRINVRAAAMLTQRLLPAMRPRYGQIVFINSSAGESAKAQVGQYAATKHALRAIADSLRDEVNATGRRVLSVFLGRTATPMQAAIHEMEGKPYRPDRLAQPEDIATMVIGALRLPWTAEVTDIRIRPFQKT